MNRSKGACFRDRALLRTRFGSQAPRMALFLLSIIAMLLSSLPYIAASECGDGVIDWSSGETCDPGESIVDSCCDSSSCHLMKGCECGNTEACCENGAFVNDSRVCRPKTNDCDLEERCDGSSSECPPDFVEPPGTACAAGEGLCLDRECATPDSSCPDGASRCPGVSSNCSTAFCTWPDGSCFEAGPVVNGTSCSTDPEDITHQCFTSQCTDIEYLFVYEKQRTGWTVCSDEELGDQQEILSCFDASGNAAASHECRLSARLPLTRPCGSCAGIECGHSGTCSEGACICSEGVAGELCNFKWSEDEFPECPESTSCTPLTQHRSVECQTLLGDPADHGDEDCVGVPRPDESRECPASTCSYGLQCRDDLCVCNSDDCGFDWVESDRGECSQPCNNDGFAFVNVTCRLTGDDSVVVSSPRAKLVCLSEQPPSIQSCNELSCIWDVGTVGDCSVLCGTGQQNITYKCTNPNLNFSEVDDVHCLSSVPSSLQPCNQHSCDPETVSPSSSAPTAAITRSSSPPLSTASYPTSAPSSPSPSVLTNATTIPSSHSPTSNATPASPTTSATVNITSSPSSTTASTEPASGSNQTQTPSMYLPSSAPLASSYPPTAPNISAALADDSLDSSSESPAMPNSTSTVANSTSDTTNFPPPSTPAIISAAAPTSAASDPSPWPTSSWRCDSMSSCSEHGSCRNGTCVCHDRFSGMRCDEEPSIQIINVIPKVVSSNTTIVVAWNTTGAIGPVSLLLYRASSCVIGPTSRHLCWPVDILANSITSSRANIVVDDTWPLSEDYYIRVVASSTVSATTSYFDVASPCEIGNGCANNGTCNSMDLCSCTSAFCGHSCRIPKCDRVDCVMGTCIVDKCVCEDGFSGPSCNDLTSCDLPCVHGSTARSRCSRCECDEGWRGTACDQCVLECGQIQGNGVADASCSHCICQPGRTGSYCQKRYIDMRLYFSIDFETVQGHTSTSDAFARMLRTELSTAVNFHVERVSVEHVYEAHDGVAARVRFLEEESGIPNSADRAVISLLHRYEHKQPPFTDGFILSHIDWSKEPVRLDSNYGVDDPEETPAPPVTTSNSFPWTTYVYIAALAFCFVILFFLPVYSWRRWLRFRKAKRLIDGLKEADMGSLALDLFAEAPMSGDEAGKEGQAPSSCSSSVFDSNFGGYKAQPMTVDIENLAAKKRRPVPPKRKGTPRRLWKNST